VAYVKTTWVDEVTPTSAANFNHMEQGIYDAVRGQAEDALRVVRGHIGAAGGVAAGVGFTITKNGTGDYTIACDSEQNDVSGWYDPAQSRFTPQLAGIYWLVHRVNTTQVLASGTNVEARIVQNTGGAAQKVNANRSQASNATSGVYAEVTALFFFNGTTDFAEPFAWHDYSGGARGIGGDFMGFFVGTTSRWTALSPRSRGRARRTPCS
jgi:hypothetical protein